MSTWDVPAKPTLRGHFGMVASTHWLATASAQSVLERGGNAFDAAVAGAFVLHVAEPHLNGPGGDMVALISPANGGPTVVGGQGPAPAGATVEHMRVEGLDAVPGAGALAAAVPGSVVALFGLLRDHGTWELPDVLQYAIDYADAGVPAAPSLCSALETVTELFTRSWPTSRATWLPSGRPPEPGDRVVNPVYARTLERLARAGSAGGSREERITRAIEEWQGGFVARAIDEFVRMPHEHSDGIEHAGVIRESDLRAFQPSYERAVNLRFRDITVHKADIWSSGPVLLQTLAILSHFPDDDVDPATARGIHTITEAMKLAFADREAYYGWRGSVPIERLLDPDYIASRARIIGPEASMEWRPGAPDGGEPYVPPLRTDVDPHAVGVGEPTVRASGETRGDTCHLAVVDRHGNFVSATPSGGWLQSSPTIPELGFCLGTRLQMMWLDPTAPSALRPGERPRTTLSPTLISRDGVTIEAVGTPGGDQQDQWQLPYLLRRYIQGNAMQDAIDAPTFHTTHLPSSFWPRQWTPGGLVLEDRLPAEVVNELRDRGHRITLSGAWSLGRLSAVARDAATNELFAAANPRGRQGYATGR
ncbi:gamma-glutamyltransferase family protein [Haloechinothrix salitolerans]|uniref:Gamma-glutamyltransferase family protein n=1 Tax=Haloechinothrix salitolerans TaxID=926830 RepID=A0ABW2BYI7_9PSEU